MQETTTHSYFAALYLSGTDAKSELVDVSRVNKNSTGTVRRNLHGHILHSGARHDRNVIRDVQLKQDVMELPTPTHSNQRRCFLN